MMGHPAGAARRHALNARTVLARKGSLRRAEDGAPLRAPLRSGRKKDDDGRLRRDDTPIARICVTQIFLQNLTHTTLDRTLP